MTTALRPLNTGELLDRTFSLYRSHFGLFVSIFAIPHLVVLAFQCVGISFRSPTPQLSNFLVGFLWQMGVLLLTLVASAASQAATVIAVSRVHLDQPVNVSESFAYVKNRIFWVILLSLLVGFVAFMALFALIVPGILLFIMWSLAVPAMVLENKGVLDSMSRSSDLTQGSRGRIFVILFVIVVLSIAVSALLQWPIALAAGVRFFARGNLQQMGIGWGVASLVATFVSQSLVGPLGTIALSLVYYDQRIRREAFDLQLMMMTLDAPPAPSSPAQVGA